MKTKVLVTGSCGFIGHHLVRRLIADGFYVIGIDNLVAGKAEYAHDSNLFRSISILELTPEDFEGVEYVFHLAALPRVPYSWERPELTNHVNIGGTVRVLESAKRAGVKKVIYSSSSSAYGNQKTLPLREDMVPNPLSPYAVQKLAAEYYCEAYRLAGLLETVSLRYFNVFGEEQPADNPYTGVLTRFLDLKKEKKALTITGDGEQTRDFTYVGDVVEANIQAMKWSGVFNIGTGVRYSINEVAKMIGGETKYIEARKGECRHTLADNSKAREAGWEPKTDLKTWITK